MEVSRSALKAYRDDFELVPCFGIYIIDDNSMPVDIMFDKTILSAKSSKGNYLKCYSFYENIMSEEIVKEQEIISEMNKALEEKQFVVYYQPKYNVKENTPYGAEALVRWIHPEKGMISPGEFIPVFEINGFISKLDYYVWEETCKTIHKWNM